MIRDLRVQGLGLRVWALGFRDSRNLGCVAQRDPQAFALHVEKGPCALRLFDCPGLCRGGLGFWVLRRLRV